MKYDNLQEPIFRYTLCWCWSRWPENVNFKYDSLQDRGFRYIARC
jgi:hypothetical protein